MDLQAASRSELRCSREAIPAKTSSRTNTAGWRPLKLASASITAFSESLNRTLIGLSRRCVGSAYIDGVLSVMDRLLKFRFGLSNRALLRAPKLSTGALFCESHLLDIPPKRNDKHVAVSEASCRITKNECASKLAASEIKSGLLNGAYIAPERQIPVMGFSKCIGFLLPVLSCKGLWIAKAHSTVECERLLVAYAIYPFGLFFPPSKQPRHALSSSRCGRDADSSIFACHALLLDELADALPGDTKQIADLLESPATLVHSGHCFDTFGHGSSRLPGRAPLLGRRAEDVRAEVVAGDASGLLNRQHIFSRHPLPLANSLRGHTAHPSDMGGTTKRFEGDVLHG